MSDHKIRTWFHSRKGRIVGIPVGGDDTWLDIELAEDHKLHYYSESNRGRVDGHGEVLRVRRSLITEVASDDR